MKNIFFITLSILCLNRSYSQCGFELKQTGFKNSYGKIQLPTENDVYVLDDNASSFLYSHNSGVTWDSLSLPCDSLYFRYSGMQFIDEKVGYIWGEAGSPFIHGIRPYLIKTINKGITWISVNNDLPLNAAISSVHFFDEMNGICFLPCLNHTVNGHPEAYHTNDGGVTWQTENSVFPYLYGEITQIDFVDDLNGFATGRNNNLFFSKTEDGGHVWYSNVVNIMGGHGTGVKFFSPTYGVLLSNDSIYYTYDAGDIWAKSKYPFSSNIKGFVFNEDNSLGYFISDNNVYLTKDKCITWELIYTNNAVYFSDIKINQNVVFVTGTDGYILRFNLKNNIPPTPKENLLITLYPNPAKETITINYISATESSSNIFLLDAIGNQVMTFTANSLVGKNAMLINLKNLASGVYFIKTAIDNENKTTKIIKFD